MHTQRVIDAGAGKDLGDGGRARGWQWPTSLSSDVRDRMLSYLLLAILVR